MDHSFFLGKLRDICSQGGLITITQNNLDAITAATAKFASEVTDPKAAIITTYNYLLGEVRFQREVVVD